MPGCVVGARCRQEIVSPETILVVGGTGMLGSRVVRRLLADGHGVRLLVRNPDRARTMLGTDVQYAAGNVEDPGSIDRALEGCAGVHVSLSAGPAPDVLDRVEHRGTARVAEAAVQMGVSRLTHLSQMLVAEDAEIPEHRAKFRAEQAIRESGVPYTIFKPTYFMETLPRHVRGKVAVVMGRQAHPLHMLAADDFARMVSRSFQRPEAANRSLFVHGPEPVTIPEALRLYCALVEPGKRVVAMPLRFMSILDALFMGRRLRGTIELMGAMQRVGERGDPSEANELLGAPTLTLHRWCEQQLGRGHE